MAEHTERWTLNRLIATCRDGERGFRYAANHVRNPAVKALFLEIASQRDQFAADILHRGWMTLKDAVGGHDDGAMIREADRGERSALAAYEDALDGMLPPGTRDLIERQCAAVRHRHNRVHAMLMSVAPV